MAVFYKVEREQWRLEIDINVPPVDTNFQFRTLWGRTITYYMRHRQIDRQTSRGQKPINPPRSNSLKISSKVTCYIPTHLPSTQDKTIGNIFRQDHLKIPIPTPRHGELYLIRPTKCPTLTNF